MPDDLLLDYCLQSYNNILFWLYDYIIIYHQKDLGSFPSITLRMKQKTITIDDHIVYLTKPVNPDTRIVYMASDDD